MNLLLKLQFVLLSSTLFVKAQLLTDGGLQNCNRPDNVPPIPSTSETDVRQLALCQSLCLERVILLNETEMLLPGFPLWTLATQSYLVSDMALMGKDCLSGDMMQCGEFNCVRFVQTAGALPLVLECKRGCLERLKNPNTAISNCYTTCRSDCLNECGSGFCFSDRFPPCGLICEDFSGNVPCRTGCDVVDMEYSNIDSYPVEANPTQPPTVNKIPGTRATYEIDIINSIPSTDGSIVGGYGTIVVRVEDLSSNGGFSYFALENGTEIDLEAFICHRVSISFAVATAMLDISDYSPAVTMAVGEETVFGPQFPRQIDSFTFSVEEDTSRFQKLIIHLSWNQPQDIEFATGYLITISSRLQSGVCSQPRNISINDVNLIEYSIQSTDELLSPPITGCVYDITVEVLPRARNEAPATDFVGVGSYTYPTSDDVSFECSAQVNRARSNYDIIISPAMLSEAFTPVVRDAIGSFQVIFFEENDAGSFTEARRVDMIFNIDRATVFLNNDPVSVRGNFITIAIVLVWDDTLVPRPNLVNRIVTTCTLEGLEFIPPDPVTNIEINFINSSSSVSAESQTVYIALEFSWSPPQFLGSGIQVYQVWLEEREAENVPTNFNSLVLDGEATSGNLTRVFKANGDTLRKEFHFYFQIRPVGVDSKAVGLWSSPKVLIVSSTNTLAESCPGPMTDVNTELDLKLNGILSQVVSNRLNIASLLQTLVSVDNKVNVILLRLASKPYLAPRQNNNQN